MNLPEPLSSGDEGRHHPEPGDRLWNESWYFDWAAADASIGGYLRWSLYPNLGVGWFWAAIVGRDRPLVTTIDHTLPIPDDPHALDVDIDELHCTIALDRPFTRVRIAWDSNAAVHADPAAVFIATAGDTVPTRGDLRFETAGAVYPYPGVTRYEVPCHVEGTLDVDGTLHRIDAPGERDHSWGHRDWWSFGWVWTSGHLEDGTAFHATEVRIPGLDYTPGFVIPPGGALDQIDRFVTHQDTGTNGIPVRSRMEIDGLSLEVTPVAHAPVPLVDPEGRTGRLHRALCRFDAADGRQGTGWTEWNQPESSDT